MPLLTDIGLLVTPVPHQRQGVLEEVHDAVLAWVGDRITWVGPRERLPPELASSPRHSAQSGLVIPGLIDCHTHLAFGGWRAAEFEQRILGRTYEEIQAAGGGILQTVNRTRTETPAALVERCVQHLQQISMLGVTTVECKSGYGLDVEHELKLLRVYREVAGRQPVRIAPTLLAAHVLPLEFASNRDGFVDMVRRVLIPTVAREGLAVFCDVFVERSAFTAGEARAILSAAIEHGLIPKLHADQLSDGGGAALAADLAAASADHLEHVSQDGIARLAAAGTVAVSLPLATLYLAQAAMPARVLLDAGVEVAVATDFNPGTAPSYHLPLAMMLACTMQHMTPAEVLSGVTSVAARALRREEEIGTLAPGRLADFAVIDAPSVSDWLYHFRANACVQTWVGGRRIH